MKPRRRWPVILGLVALAAFAAPFARADQRTPTASGSARPAVNPLNCATNRAMCTEVDDSEFVFGEDHYVGHDEPSTLFYSDIPGAGNDNTYFLRLPEDPPQQPAQDGSGSSWNFQLHPAFWFGMAMCDDQSAPGPGGQNAACQPDSDSNIYTDTDVNSPRFIGKHPGAAFMEMQFYPPGWVSWPAGNSCDPTKWCAALNIDSLSLNYDTGTLNNDDCLNKAGVEYVNFAFLTDSGQATTPADPTNNDRFNLDPAHDAFYNSGDVLKVHMFDTQQGFRVEVTNVTQHNKVSSMTASMANGFKQVAFQPTATTCQTIPSAFHPMYSTSSENTRVPWAAHSYNVAFSDEIGHFEYCAAADPATGACTQAAGGDGTVDADDNYCFNPSDSLLAQVGGCLSEAPTDDDYDGVPYGKTWPGSGGGTATPDPIAFSSPLIHGLWNFQRSAFETDLPRIEDNDTLPVPCNRATGANCVNPPPGSQFYPIFVTHQLNPLSCVWQEGGPAIPGASRTFGGTSQAEFGSLFQLAYPRPGGVSMSYNDFRQILPHNPCFSLPGDLMGPLMGHKLQGG
ncbi:hypothetical protein [Catenulispora subtropica]|uniref:Uncharacterized protein n=1 Tax=Catenulispora subtropica TaxID=450798 RepID=A0ABN2SEZ7_9ACTN